MNVEPNVGHPMGDFSICLNMNKSLSATEEMATQAMFSTLSNVKTEANLEIY